MGEFFDAVRALEEIKKHNKVSHVHWSSKEFIVIGIDGKMYDQDGDACGFFIPHDNLKTDSWKIYNGSGNDFVQGPLELIRSLGSGVWSYATIVDNDAWGPDDKIVLRGGDTLEWQGGEGIPVYKTILEAKFQLHK